MDSGRRALGPNFFQARSHRQAATQKTKHKPDWLVVWCVVLHVLVLVLILVTAAAAMGPRKRPAAAGHDADNEPPGADAAPEHNEKDEPKPKKTRSRKKAVEPTEPNEPDGEDAAVPAAEKPKRQRKKSSEALPVEPNEPDGEDAAVPAAEKPKRQRKQTSEAPPVEPGEPNGQDGAVSAAEKPKRQRKKSSEAPPVEPGEPNGQDGAVSSAEKPKRQRKRTAGVTEPDAASPKAKAKGKAKAKAKGRSRKTQDDSEVKENVAPDNAKEPKKKKKGKEGEINYFELPPDPDQARISTMFGWPSEPVDLEVGKENGKDTESSSSSTSSSSSSGKALAALGDMKEEEDMCQQVDEAFVSILPDTTRNRQEMFSFPQRNVQRIAKHWGDEKIANLKNNVKQASLVSLYSGLGGAEIAMGMLASALSTKEDPIQPKYVLACDHSNDCQKILHSHTDTMA